MFQCAIRLLLGILVLILVPAGTPSAETTRIGVVLPITGPQAQLGVELANAARLAFDERSASSNSPRGLELKFFDDRCEPRYAVLVAREAIEVERVSFLVGFPCRGSTAAASHALQQLPIIALFLQDQTIPPTRSARDRARFFFLGGRRSQVDTILGRIEQLRGYSGVYTRYCSDVPLGSRDYHQKTTVVCRPHPLGSEIHRTFAERYRSRFGTAPAFPSALDAYVAVSALVDAMARSRSIEYGRVAEALSQATFGGTRLFGQSGAIPRDELLVLELEQQKRARLAQHLAQGRGRPPIPMPRPDTLCICWETGCFCI